MNGDERRSPSSLTRVYNDLQQLLPSDQCDQIFTLINSAVVSNDMTDEEIARQHQEHLMFNSYMDVDQPSLPGATGNNIRQLEELDAAIARQLQEEEYSRKSLVPSRSHNPKFSSVIIDPYEPPVLSDAELAEHIQAEENQNQNRQRHRPRPAISSQRRIVDRTDEPEVIPFPAFNRPAQQRPTFSRNNNRNNDVVPPFLQMFAAIGQRPPGNRGARNIQNTNRDFGPNDYETLLELDNSIGGRPLSRQQINRLPTEKFRRTGNQNAEENKCSICMDEFEENQTLRRLTCLHRYHDNCIDNWLKTKNECPICRVAQNS